MTAPEWRDCADPDELAAAVAAGVEVLAMGRAGDFPTANQTADQFAWSLRAGITYQLPASWTWRPEPTPEPGDPRDAVRLLDLAWGVIANADGWGDDTSWRQAAERWRDGYHRFLDALREEPTAPPAPTPPPAPPSPDLVGLADGNEHPVTIPPDGDTDPGLIRQLHDMADRWGARGVMETGATLWPDAPPPTPTPPPVPPWPGAVLSGLTDEDGVPTWLAQAGQVRGEQVRACTSVPWLPNTSYGEDEWVEVRAPRAVPAALVTVTIPAETAHALLRYIEDGDYDTDYVIDRLADLLIAAMDGDQ